LVQFYLLFTLTTFSLCFMCFLGYFSHNNVLLYTSFSSTVLTTTSLKCTAIALVFIFNLELLLDILIHPICSIILLPVTYRMFPKVASVPQVTSYLCIWSALASCFSLLHLCVKYFRMVNNVLPTASFSVVWAQVNFFPKI
jgi:hypothetical protein